MAAAPLPVVAMAGACAPVVGTAGTNHGCSCEEHTCCNNVLDNDVLVKLWREEILVSDAIAGGGG